MNHSFQPSFTDITKCAKCTFKAELHGDSATCESCNNVGNLNPCNGMALCRECIAKEVNNSLPSVPVNAIIPSNPIKSALLEVSKGIDSSINVASDLFNANTVAIIELKAAIDADDSIASDKKHYKLAEMLLERFNQHKKAIFEHQQAIVQKHSDQVSIQQYLNNLSVKFSAEEREKLKLADINYKPETTTVKAVKVAKPKTDKFTNAEIKMLCRQFNVDEYKVRMAITSRQISLMDAVMFVINAEKAAKQTPAEQAQEKINEAIEDMIEEIE